MRRELLKKLQEDNLEPGEVAKELEEKHPVEKLNFEQECAFWGIWSDSEVESERSSERSS